MIAVNPYILYYALSFIAGYVVCLFRDKRRFKKSERERIYAEQQWTQACSRILELETLIKKQSTI